MIKMARGVFALAGLFCLAIFGFVFVAPRWWGTHPVLVTTAFVCVVVGYVATIMVLILWVNRTQRRIKMEEAAKRPPGAVSPAPRIDFQPSEYRSRQTLLGLPLIHI